jgi:hypothetical protein
MRNEQKVKILNNMVLNLGKGQIHIVTCRKLYKTSRTNSKQ